MKRLGDGRDNLRVTITDLAIAVTASLLLKGTTQAQFSTVTDIPPMPDIGDHASISSSTQVNLRGNGKIGLSFDVGAANVSNTNVELNVLGGSVGNELQANPGSVTNIRIGVVGNQMAAFAGSVVNISGGSVGNGFDANSGSMVNISGGSVGRNMEAFAANVNISGGTVSTDFHVFSDSLVNVSGGTVSLNFFVGALDGSSTNVRANLSGGVLAGDVEVSGDADFTATGGYIGIGKSGIDFNALSLGLILGGVVDPEFDTFMDSDVRLFGSDFRLDDMPVAAAGQKVNVPPGSILTGILADGTPIMLSDKLDDNIANNTLSLHGAAPPPVGPPVIMVPGGTTPPPGIRGPQKLIVTEGGTVGNFFRAGPGSSVSISGGEIGLGFEAFGATIDISGGRVFSDFAAYQNSVVNLSGGSIGGFLRVGGGTVMNMSGGSVGINFIAGSGSQVNISGGSIGTFFSADSNSEVNISGGTFGSLGASEGSAVKISGGDFRLDGVPIDGLGTIGNTKAVTLPPGFGDSAGVVLSGTLADGTPFVISTQATDNGISGGTVTLEAAAIPPVGPSAINVPGNPAPQGIRQGQTLTLSEGGVIGDPIGFLPSVFNAAPGSTVIVTGGEVRSQFNSVGATVNVSGGTVHGLNAFTGSHVNISGASTVFRLQAYNGSDSAVSGGTISGAVAHRGSVVEIAGGTFLGNFIQRAFEANSSEVNVSGGDFQGRFGAFGSTANIRGGNFDVFTASGGEINLFGTEFFLGGVEIAGLVMDQPFTITDRNVTLSGILANGSPFSFDLSTTLSFDRDFVTADTLLTVTLVDSFALPGDYNRNGTVDAADYAVWRNTVGQTGNGLAADGNGNDTVDAGDYDLWRANFGRTSGVGAIGSASTFEAIPEPATLALALLAFARIILTTRVRPSVRFTS
jgi:hypothetical protein